MLRIRDERGVIIAGIMMECPTYRRKQSLRNKKCAGCDEALDRAKKANRVEYCTHERMTVVDGGVKKTKQKFRCIGRSFAEAKTEAAKARIRRQETPCQIASKSLTFQELTDWYVGLESVKRLNSYQSICNRLWKFNRVFGERRADAILPSELRDCRVGLQKKYKDNTVDHIMGEAKRVIYTAERDFKVSAQPAQVFRSVRNLMKLNQDARDRIVSPEEFDRILDYLDGPARHISLLAYSTGMRRGEILNLTWSRAFLDQNLIQLDAGNTKTDEARCVPFGPEIHAVFEEIERVPGNDDVSHWDGGKDKTKHRLISDPFKAAVIRAGLPQGRKVRNGIIFHDLRHTFNTNARKAGISPTVIMKITGHKSFPMFKRYDTIDIEGLQKAVVIHGQFREFEEGTGYVRAEDRVAPPRLHQG